MARSQLQDGPATDHYHTALGTAQTPGGSGLILDNTVDPPAQVMTLIAPGTVISGDEADLSGRLGLRLLGPYSFNHDDAELAWKPLNTSLAAGVLVVAAWPILLEPFNGGGVFSIQIAVGDPDGVTENIGQWHADSIPIATDATIAPEPVGTSLANLKSNLLRPGVITGPTGDVIVYFNQGDAPPSEGESDIYVLIAEPA